MSTKNKKKIVNDRWHLYMLRCSDGTLYTGITTDIARRTDQHNHGTASRYTRTRRPVQLIHHERCRSRSSALRKEYAIKQLPKGVKAAYIGAASAAERAGILRKKGGRT